MNTKLALITKTFLKWLLAMFRHLYAVKENGQIVGFIGMDGTFINNEDYETERQGKPSK
jgi:hypothetical protein